MRGLAFLTQRWRIICSGAKPIVAFLLGPMAFFIIMLVLNTEVIKRKFRFYPKAMRSSRCSMGLAFKTKMLQKENDNVRKCLDAEAGLIFLAVTMAVIY